jgi:hypothetical protein
VEEEGFFIRVAGRVAVKCVWSIVRTHIPLEVGGWRRQAGGQTGPMAGRQQAGLAAGGSSAAREERREKGESAAMGCQTSQEEA